MYFAKSQGKKSGGEGIGLDDSFVFEDYPIPVTIDDTIEDMEHQMNMWDLQDKLGRHVNIINSTPESLEEFSQWVKEASTELGIPPSMLFNTAKSSNDISIDLNNEYYKGMLLGGYRPSEIENWEHGQGPRNEYTTQHSWINPQELLFTEEGLSYQGGPQPWAEDIMFQDGEWAGEWDEIKNTYVYPTKEVIRPYMNIFGHEVWHGLDSEFKSGPVDPEEYGSGTEFDYDLDRNLNAFGGSRGAEEFEALQRSWDRMPNQWHATGSNIFGKTIFEKDNQMRDAMVNKYLNSENFQYLPESARGPLALALATAASSGDYETRINNEFGDRMVSPIWEDSYRPPIQKIMREMREGEHPPGIGSDYTGSNLKYLNIDYNDPIVRDIMDNTRFPNIDNIRYENTMNERAARFIGPAIGTGYAPLSGFSMEDQIEQYPALKKALGDIRRHLDPNNQQQFWAN